MEVSGHSNEICSIANTVQARRAARMNGPAGTLNDYRRDHAMNDNIQHSSTWVSFSYASFGVAAAMLAIGINIMPLDLWGKGYLTMGILMLLQTAVNLTKTIRDNQESDRQARHADEARVEKRLFGINHSDAN
jgi:hypothetical protein